MTRKLFIAALIALTVPSVAEAAPQAGSYCTTSVVYTWGTKYPTCNLRQPQQLHVLGISYSTCLSWGGTWGGYIKLKDGSSTTICRDVDY